MTAILIAVAAACAALSIRRVAVDPAHYLGAPPVAPTPIRLPGGALLGAATGVAAALATSGAVVAAAVLGGVGGALAQRARRRSAAARRARRLFRELPTIADTLGLRVVVGESVNAAVSAVSTACSGVASEELAAALRAADGLEAGLRRAARDSAHPDAGRLYDRLGQAIRTGGPLAESLFELAADYRESAKADLTAEGGRRALTAYGPILAFMVPVTLVFLMYPTLSGLSALSP